MSPGIYILLATIFLFLLFGGVFLYKYFKKEWPIGKRIKSSYKGYTVYFIYDKDSEQHFKNPVKVNANICAKASWATGNVWMKKRMSGMTTSSIFKTIIVHALGDENYDKIYDEPYNVKSNGVLLSSKVGRKEYPLVACRASAFRSTETDGNLVIHELTHLILKHTSTVKYGVPPYGDLDHVAKGYWNDSEDSLGVEAQKLFLTVRDEQ